MTSQALCVLISHFLLIYSLLSLLPTLVSDLILNTPLQNRQLFSLNWIVAIGATLGPRCQIFLCLVCLTLSYLPALLFSQSLLHSHLLLEDLQEHSLKYHLPPGGNDSLSPFVLYISYSIFHYLMHFIVYWVSYALKYKCFEDRNIFYFLVSSVTRKVSKI